MMRPTYCVGLREGVFLNQPYAADQVVVPVLILGNGRRGVVVGAQANGGICQTIPFARELAARGYHVAVFEWREPNSAAMAAATTALADAGAQRIVVGGFSEGAVIGLGEVPQLGPRVIGVMSISGGPSPADGYPTVQSVSNFRGPLLLISAKDDPLFPPGTSQAIAARHAGPEDLLVVPGSDHALALLDGEHAQEVRAAIYRFLARVTR